MKFVAKHLIGVAQEMRRLMDDNLKRQGLTGAQIHVLGFLHYKHIKGERCIQREICAACGDVRASSVTSLLKGLEEAGHITREQGRDAREKVVRLTEQGLAVAENCRRYMDKVEENFVRGFEDEQIEEFLSLLKLAKENLEQMAKSERGRGE